MDQQSREEKLAKFRQKRYKLLIVTDLAARGIDIPLLENVINFDFPTTKKLFIHRSGRTARAGQKGTTYSLLTKDELAYMHDLSAFVGKKYYDTVQDNIDVINDPECITYGAIPTDIMEMYIEQSARLHSRKKLILDPLIDSMKKSLTKYNRTKEPASTLAMQETHGLKPSNHPLLLNRVDEKQKALADFKSQVTNYKPKVGALQLAFERAKNTEAVSLFNKIGQQQQTAVENKKVREEMQHKIEEERAKQMQILEKNQIEMGKWEHENK